jgi:hypothetical protein
VGIVGAIILLFLLIHILLFDKEPRDKRKSRSGREDTIDRDE